MNSQRLDLAEKTLKQIISDQPNFGQAYRVLGSVYSLKNDQILSKKYIIRAGDLKIYTPPVDINADRIALISRSDSYLLKQIDDAEKGGYSNFAIDLISNGLVNIPNDKYLISKAIKIYLLMGLKELAQPYFDKHMQYFSEDINEIKMVADICMKKGLYSQAMKYYTQAAKFQPDDIDAQLSLVLCLGNQGMKQQATESMKMLIEKNKENIKVFSDGVYVMLMLGEKEKALSYLTKIKALSPKNPKVLQLSGLVMEQEGNNQGALALYESSFNADPEDLVTARYLGELLVRMRMWNRSIDLYRKALEFHPNEPYLLEGLGNLLVMCPDASFRNISEGREFAERAFINMSSPPMTLISAGRCLSAAYAALGDNENAINYMKFTINMAHKENAPADFIENLESQLKQYSK